MSGGDWVPAAVGSLLALLMIRIGQRRHRDSQSGTTDRWVGTAGVVIGFAAAFAAGTLMFSLSDPLMMRLVGGVMSVGIVPIALNTFKRIDEQAAVLRGRSAGESPDDYALRVRGVLGRNVLIGTAVILLMSALLATSAGWLAGLEAVAVGESFVLGWAWLYRRATIRRQNR